MSVILHLPQGSAQVTVVSQIPEKVLSGETLSVEEIQNTFSKYMYCVGDDGVFKTVNEMWDTYLEYEKDPQQGDGTIINGSKHYGINLYPSMRREEVNFIFIDKVINFPSKRMIIESQVDESEQTQSTITFYFLPYNAAATKEQEMVTLHDMIVNGIENNNIILASYLHTGFGEANAEKRTILTELINSGKYKVAIKGVCSAENGAPSIYGLNFRTY